jgi:hypothetical protein
VCLRLLQNLLSHIFCAVTTRSSRTHLFLNVKVCLLREYFSHISLHVQLLCSLFYTSLYMRTQKLSDFTRTSRSGFYKPPEGWSCSACKEAGVVCPDAHRDPLHFMPVAKDSYYDQEQFLPHVCSVLCFSSVCVHIKHVLDSMWNELCRSSFRRPHRRRGGGAWYRDVC